MLPLSGLGAGPGCNKQPDLITLAVEAPKFVSGIVRYSLARSVISVLVLRGYRHPQLASVYALVYSARFRNTRNYR